VWHQSSTEEAIRSAAGSVFPAAQPSGKQPNVEPGQGLRPLDVACPQVSAQGSLLAPCSVITIEEAIESYLQEQRANGRSHKTME
jgi:hypothetical protein